MKLDHTQSTISPFDSPSMPYEKDGVFNMLVGQGQMETTMAIVVHFINQKITERHGNL